eukprot:TRINITY_DN5463_c0_g1_i1.p1 TRINITY_DN5463_c0_g1~~TRINITY_DN5463_c0_g1_i1.p1  ORF type:complete len:213 (-),score=52.39 TRINITY_DN5463_c0_g1_i1:29-667(-)
MPCCGGESTDSRGSVPSGIKIKQTKEQTMMQKLKEGAKLCLLGDAATGKTCLVSRFCNGFYTEHEATIGASFLMKELVINSDVTIKFHLWDTAGDERYHAIAPMYYRGALAAIIAYDITNLESFDRVSKWLDEIKEKMGKDAPVMAIVGTKCDLSDSRQVTEEAGQSLADKYKILWMETSAKTGQNITELFLLIGKQLVDRSKGGNRISFFS